MNIFHYLFSLMALLLTANAVSQENCQSCHTTQSHAWSLSDHAHAMASVGVEPPLANFDNAQFAHQDTHVTFSLTSNPTSSRYFVEIKQAQHSKKYEILYSFGHYPLQQYLIATEKGRMQVLPYAWDSRTATQGGQTWFHIYGDEAINQTDRRHWLQPLQNWNGMCADCHSTALIRGYNPAKDQFDTQWQAINVSCQACHTVTDDHQQGQAGFPQDGEQPDNQVTKGQWLRADNARIAHYQGSPRDKGQMDTCFACHSLRTPLTDGFTQNKAFLDQFSPRLVQPVMYHADGQIKEEVYVYGSFLQSKMYQAGVTCMDCHDPHSMKLKKQGNGVCTQCHNPEFYDNHSHTLHQKSSEGSQCVDCHMPATTFMQVDDRRDHSFSVPRPGLSAQLDSPLACQSCHLDKDTSWFSTQLKDHFGREYPLSESLNNLYRLRAGKPVSLKAHRAIIDDTKIAFISRATALELLASRPHTEPLDWLETYLIHKEPLLRLAATRIAGLLPPKRREALLTERLNDPLKSVRVAAARVLNQSGSQVNSLQELKTANAINGWRGEGRLNQALFHQANGDSRQAAKELTHGIEVDPLFAPGYINLAQLLRVQGNTTAASTALQQGLAQLPTSPDIHYAIGLDAYRQGDNRRALAHLQQAAQLEPSTASFQLAYILMLEKQKHLTQALELTQNALTKFEFTASYPQFEQLASRISQALKVKSQR